MGNYSRNETERASEIERTDPRLYPIVRELAASLGYGIAEMQLSRDLPEDERLSWGGRYIQSARLIVVNYELGQGARAYCLAHELGHARLHAGREQFLNYTRSRRLRNLVEVQADRYAHWLLFLISRRLARAGGAA